MARHKNILITIEGEQYRVKFYEERRNGLRMSFGKDAIIFRMPYMLKAIPGEKEKAFDWLHKVVLKRIKKDPQLLSAYIVREIKDGNTLTVGERDYFVKIDYTDKKTHAARLRNGVIQLELAKGDSEFHLQKSIRHLLSRVVAKDFKPDIVRRVLEINNLYFNKPIKSVNLKYNRTNWGSCSAKGNVNLSTCLLFAPDDVIDYVIIHELAHLIELNHSHRFWKIVADAMPDYEDKEKWLKENHHKCDFQLESL